MTTVITKHPVAQQNGPVIDTPPSPEQLAVAHGIANYQRVISERDELQKRVDKMEQTMTIAKIEIEQLRAERSTVTSRMESYQHERDDAVTHLAVYQTLYISMQALMRTFGIDHAPLVREGEDIIK